LECDAPSGRFIIKTLLDDGSRMTNDGESKRMTKNRADRFLLGHSPDPDDAFMFYAMAENKIDLRGYGLSIDWKIFKH
jgi:hypothetical protein